MQNEYAARMALRSDEQLISIVTVERDDYLPEALEAAEAELAARELSIDEMKQATDALEERQLELRMRADEPLNDLQKIKLLLLPGFGSLLTAKADKSRGYVRRYNDTKVWLMYGFIFWMGILALFVLVMVVGDFFAAR